MIFTISNMIMFRSEDDAMWNIAYPDRRLSLTTIPARLFTYLLENADKMISREELLNNIWDKYGLDPSNNSVNQYISLIRKSLNELGCEEEIIKTIPRAGFYISGERVSVSKATKQVAEARNIESVSTKWEQTLQRSYRPILLGISLVVAIFLVIQPFHLTSASQDERFPTSILYKVGNIGTCPVYSLNKNPSENALRKEQIARDLAADNAACFDNNMYIIQIGEHYSYKKEGRAFMTRCTYSDNTLTHFADCKDVYVYAK
ncbi:winged helix-turn-helix domain-containing protein [Serratia sp. L9]|uniref:winged helix-turn-helix domain-containing protein n=1 Tax=Serratia sp. L9 TaxID=3423946 RepID=UPI003D67AD9C